MYNNDEMYEVNDYDEDIQDRQALIEEVKSLQQNSEGNLDMRAISDLKRRWKRISYWESAYEDQLAEEFDSYIDAFYGKRREEYAINQEAKQKLIEEAKEVSLSNDWKQATKQMTDLMSQWKEINSAGKDTDDLLWNEFNEARQTFFDRKHKHWEDMRVQFENALQVKKDLIVEAASIMDSKDWQKTGEAFKQLMDKWKAAGSAGREHEDELWNEFNACRQKFYDQRNEYYEALNEQYLQKYEAKKALVEQAQGIADTQEYSRNNTEKMKILSNEWKTVGSCGKDREDKVWKQFRSSMDAYFDGLRAFNDQKHEQWRERILDARTRKQEQIQNQKRQISRLQRDIVGLLGERAINETMEEIEDKKAFISELEAELADIEKTLEQK